MKKILLFAFTIFAFYSPFYSFAQNQNISSNGGLAQVDLPDKTPAATKAALTNIKPNASANNIGGTSKPSAINKSKLLDADNNILSHTNDLVSALLGTGKVTSLMFDDQELVDIDRAIDSFKNNQTFVPEQDPNAPEAKKDNGKKTKDPNAEDENEKSYIYLASIIYYSPKDWAVWINNIKIASDNNKNSKELFVKEIYSDHVKIIWSLSISKWKILSGKKSEDLAPKLNDKNNVQIVFTLKPNQTFILGSGLVVEGHAVTNLIKGKELVKEKDGQKK